jgi:hypothetical protein
VDDIDVYLNTLFDGLEGLVYSPVKSNELDERGERKWKSNWFNYPAERSLLVEHITNSTTDGDVYISPAIYSEKKPKKPYIKKVQTVWVEFDGQATIDPKAAPEPTMMVQTSSDTHVHCYWRVEPTNATSVEDINRRLTYYLEADYSGWDPTQLLRPPGTFNYKRSLPVVLSHNSGEFFTAARFDFVPKVAAPPSADVTVETLLKVSDILNSHQLPAKLVKMVKKESPVEPHRSSFLARLANELAEENLTHVEIVSLLKEADGRIKKYSDRSDQLLRLSQIADYALLKHEAGSEIIIYSPEAILKHVDSLSWIIPNYLHTTGLMMISSAPGVGKTQLMFQLAHCLASGERWLGYQAPAIQRPFFFSLEMDVRSLKYIMENHSHEWPGGPVYFPVIDEAADSLVIYENLIAEHEPTVLIIDSLTELFDDTADNAQAEARRVMKWTRKIRRRYGVAIILIHHNRKATEGNKKPKGLADLAGSFQFGKEADTVLQLWEESTGRIELSGVKVRFGPKSAFYINRNEHLWFERDNEGSRKSSTDSRSETRNSGVANLSFRHGDADHKPSLGKVSFRFGSKNPQG